MKIFAIMLVKDEIDIVRYVIEDAQKWANKIFILDNGSTDGTWELIQSMQNNIVVPWKQDFQTYHNGLRANVYNAFKGEGKAGDWWCYKLDADEFYVDDPRTFLQNIPKEQGWVAKKSLDYYLTQSDVDNYQFTGDFLVDREHIKHIRRGCWSEGRFFCQRDDIKWECDPDQQQPLNPGLLSPQKILLKHYQFRSPKQMQIRLDVRNAKAIKDMNKSFRHVKETQWQELLWDENDCILDDGNIETYRSLPLRSPPKKPLKDRVLSKFSKFFR